MTTPTNSTPTPTVSTAARWTGRVLSYLPCLLLVFSGVMKFSSSPDLAKGMDALGIPLALAPKLGVLELVCTALYLIPRTSMLGAILLTGYLGGATAIHVRVGDPFIMTVLLGVALWGGLFLREPRLRALIPLRR